MNNVATMCGPKKLYKCTHAGASGGEQRLPHQVAILPHRPIQAPPYTGSLIALHGTALYRVDVWSLCSLTGMYRLPYRRYTGSVCSFMGNGRDPPLITPPYPAAAGCSINIHEAHEPQPPRAARLIYMSHMSHSRHGLLD